jgi:hypothetical protein
MSCYRRIADAPPTGAEGTGYAEAFETNAKELVAKADGNWPTVEARLATQ